MNFLDSKCAEPPPVAAVRTVRRFGCMEQALENTCGAMYSQESSASCHLVYSSLT